MPKLPRGEGDERYSTHQFLLEFIIKEFEVKTAFEAGMGRHSTRQILAWGAEALVSVETNMSWIQRTKTNDLLTEGKTHIKRHCRLATHGDSFVDFLNEEYDLVFVDCKPRTERPKIVTKAFGLAKFIVEHDSEDWPEGRWMDRSLPFNYLEERVDPTGEYLPLNFEHMDPNTLVWTNDKSAYQRLLEFKKEIEEG